MAFVQANLVWFFGQSKLWYVPRLKQHSRGAVVSALFIYVHAIGDDASMLVGQQSCPARCLIGRFEMQYLARFQAILHPVEGLHYVDRFPICSCVEASMTG